MLIYGSRMYFKKNTVKTTGECEHCGTYGNLTSYQAKKFGHLYFIPILPMGPHSQVLRECPQCRIGTHLSMTDLEPIVALACRSVQIVDHRDPGWSNRISFGG